jgi:hypothetical protein
VFTKEKHTITEHDNLTNWKSSGYFEMCNPVGKYRVKRFKFLGNIPLCYRNWETIINKFYFQSGRTLLYYLFYWQQNSFLKTSSKHLYILVKTCHLLCTLISCRMGSHNHFSNVKNLLKTWVMMPEKWVVWRSEVHLMLKSVSNNITFSSVCVEIKSFLYCI